MTYKILDCRWKLDISVEEKKDIQKQNKDFSQPMTLAGFDYLVNDGVNSFWVDAIEFRRRQKFADS